MHSACRDEADGRPDERRGRWETDASSTRVNRSFSKARAHRGPEGAALGEQVDHNSAGHVVVGAEVAEWLDGSVSLSVASGPVVRDLTGPRELFPPNAHNDGPDQVAVSDGPVAPQEQPEEENCEESSSDTGDESQRGGVERAER
jgi:hypothetical protein